MNEKSNEIRLPKLIIVEGSHERDFFEAWLRKLKRRDVQVMPIGGKTRIRKELPPLVKQASFGSVTVLVILRDADDNPSGAFQSICSALRMKGVALPCPDKPFAFTKGSVPRVAVGLLPGEGRTGALEDLLLESVQSDPATPLAGQFIDHAGRELLRVGLRPSPPPHRLGKATVHAYLATFDEPDRDQGKAALAGVWPFDAPAFDALRELLASL